MRAFTFGLPALCALWLLAPAAGVAQSGIEPTPYFPLAVGTTWTYRVHNDKITLRVAKNEKVGDAACARIEGEGLGKKEVEWVGSTKEGVFRHKVGEDEIKPPLCLLPLPLKDDAAWQWKSDAGALRITGDWKLAKEEIQVPAGKYQAVVARGTDVQFGTRRLTITYWFAPDVGMVKQRLEIGDRALELELESFTAGK